MKGVRAHGPLNNFVVIVIIYFFSYCLSFLSSRVFRMWVWVWIGIDQFHFLDCIEIGIGCEGVGYLDVVEKQYSHPHPIVNSLLTPTTTRPLIHLHLETHTHIRTLK